ncbi:MAG TPA: phospholipid carrier-dependent glycosyltransferase [Candidatus Angelobacter sp.]|nr:phospholipid carrier-dependent glycosyltransferase [Candidatus Angelobacter sp.]
MANFFSSRVSALAPEQEFTRPSAFSKERGAEDFTEKSGETDGQSPFGRKVLLTALAVLLIGLVVMVSGIRVPRVFNYDEFYYVPAANGVLAGALNMDPGEPPLGKILMAIGIKLAGNNPFGWRLSGAVCGAFTLVAVFLWTQLLFGEYKVSVLAAAFTLMNNFLFVMSRVAMMDIFLVFFLFWAILAFTAAFQLPVSTAKRRLILPCSGVLLGWSGACKWNAIDTLLVFLTVGITLPLLAKLWRFPQDSPLARFTETLRRIGLPSFLISLVVLPALSYYFVYWLLYRIVGQPFGFRSFLSLNYALWRFHRTDGVAYGLFRHWYQWPFSLSPVRALSYLVGNPVVMWLGLAGVLFCLWRFAKHFGASEGLVAGLYLANFLQWAVTPARGAYYYYYFPAAMCLGVALAVTLHRLPQKIFGIRISLLVVTAAALVFVWCLPRMAHLDAPWDCALGCWT